MAVLAAAGGRCPGFERPAGVVLAVGSLERDRVVAEGIGGKGEHDWFLALFGKSGLAGKGAAAERRPLPELFGVGGAVAQRQERAVEGVGFEVEQAGLVEEAAGLDQLAGAGFALVGFEFGFLLGEPGFLLFMGAQALGQETGHRVPLLCSDQRMAFSDRWHARLLVNCRFAQCRRSDRLRMPRTAIIFGPHWHSRRRRLMVSAA